MLESDVWRDVEGTWEGSLEDDGLWDSVGFWDTEGLVEGSEETLETKEGLPVGFCDGALDSDGSADGLLENSRVG